MSYAQWVAITVDAANITLSVRNAQIPWGKFYQYSDKDQAVSVDSINQIVIAAGASVVIAACGRSGSASGTEGSFDLYDGETLAGTYYWDCPWSSKSNSSVWTPSDNKHYVGQLAGGNPDSGALGEVTLQCVKI